MGLSKGQLASANGPYIMGPDGVEVKLVKYLEVVKILAEVNKNGDVYVVGLDSHAKFWVKESSLTAIVPEQTEWKPS
jgi:hypothetical protein